MGEYDDGQLYPKHSILSALISITIVCRELAGIDVYWDSITLIRSF